MTDDDDKLKEMLMELTENNISTDFTGSVMQRIEATVSASQKRSVLKQNGPQIMIAMFVIIW